MTGHIDGSSHSTELKGITTSSEKSSNVLRLNCYHKTTTTLSFWSVKPEHYHQTLNQRRPLIIVSNTFDSIIF